jgi:hypothetical protein
MGQDITVGIVKDRKEKFSPAFILDDLLYYYDSKWRGIAVDQAEGEVFYNFKIMPSRKAINWWFDNLVIADKSNRPKYTDFNSETKKVDRTLTQIKKQYLVKSDSTWPEPITIKPPEPKTQAVRTEGTCIIGTRFVSNNKEDNMKNGSPFMIKDGLIYTYSNKDNQIWTTKKLKVFMYNHYARFFVSLDLAQKWFLTNVEIAKNRGKKNPVYTGPPTQYDGCIYYPDMNIVVNSRK